MIVLDRRAMMTGTIAANAIAALPVYADDTAVVGFTIDWQGGPKPRTSPPR